MPVLTNYQYFNSTTKFLTPGLSNILHRYFEFCIIVLAGSSGPVSSNIKNRNAHEMCEFTQIKGSPDRNKTEPYMENECYSD